LFIAALRVFAIWNPAPCSALIRRYWSMPKHRF
jgi:hypothetical protein